MGHGQLPEAGPGDSSEHWAPGRAAARHPRQCSFLDDRTCPLLVSPKHRRSPPSATHRRQVTGAQLKRTSAKYVPQAIRPMVMRSGDPQVFIAGSYQPTGAVTRKSIDLRALTPHGTESFPDCIARYLALALTGRWMRLLKDGTTVIASKSAALAERLPVPLAPLAEQRRIVARVDALFAEIAEGEAALAAARKGLDTFRRALLKAAVTGELTQGLAREPGYRNRAATFSRASARTCRSTREVPAVRCRPDPDTSGPSDLPESWAWARLRRAWQAIGTGSNATPRQVMTWQRRRTLALQLT